MISDDDDVNDDDDDDVDDGDDHRDGHGDDDYDDEERGRRVDDDADERDLLSNRCEPCFLGFHGDESQIRFLALFASHVSLQDDVITSRMPFMLACSHVNDFYVCMISLAF
eukprot:219308-Hanusia_phi.AAC.1